LLQLECDLGGRPRDLVRKVGQIVVDVSGISGKEGGKQQRAAGYQAALRWRRTWAYRAGFM
jgi:hypothetical protein